MARGTDIVSPGLRVGTLAATTRSGREEGDAPRRAGSRLRLTRSCVADADDTLCHLADSLEPAVREFSADDQPDRIRAAATQIWANVVAAASVLLDLAVFTGRLEGLARWGRGRDGVGE
jgi:hypothetical protein